MGRRCGGGSSAACAEVYRRDAYHLIFAELRAGKGNLETVGRCGELWSAGRGQAAAQQVAEHGLVTAEALRFGGRYAQLPKKSARLAVRRGGIAATYIWTSGCAKNVDIGLNSPREYTLYEILRGMIHGVRRWLRRNVNGKTRRALWVWGLLSVAWVALLPRWGSLARNSETWVPIPLGVAAMTATLMVFVVTYATLAVQIHLRYSVQLAASVLDGTAVAYGVFFSAGFVVPGVLAAAPSRVGTLISLLLFLPVTLSLVPALPFFAARLRTGWLLDRPVARAVNALQKPDRHWTRQWMSRRRRLEDRRQDLCEVATDVVYAVLAHTGDSLHDRATGRLQTRRLLRALLDYDTSSSRASAVRLMESLTQLAMDADNARLRVDVSKILVTAAVRARPETGREVLSHAMSGLRALGRAEGVTAEEQMDLARELRTVVQETVHSLSSATDPLGAPPVARRAAPKRPSPGIQPFRPVQLPSHGLAPVLSDVLSAGVAGISELTGPPARPLEDDPAARKHAEVFAQGCQLLEGLATRLLEARRWVSYDLVVDHLEEELRYRLGAGPDRSADLAWRAPQRIPYALELEAAAQALATIADRAFEAGFDDVSRRALGSLVAATEHALRADDRTAFVLCARELDSANSSLAQQMQGPPELARTARVVGIVEALQPANRAMLTSLLGLPVPVEDKREFSRRGDRGDYVQGAEVHYRTAFRQILRWALHPFYRLPAGHGSLALVIARTALQVCELGGWQQTRAGSEVGDMDVLRLETYVLNQWQVNSFSHDPRVALLAAIREGEEAQPGLTVFVASARWRMALEAAAAGLGAQKRGRHQLAGLAVGSSGYGRAGLSPEACNFLARLESWAQAPWRPTNTGFVRWPWLGDPNDFPAPLLETGIRSGDDATPSEIAPLSVLLLHHQANRHREILRAGGGNRSQPELNAAGVLWGEWPPPSACPDDPLRDDRWRADDIFGARSGAVRRGSSWTQRERRADRCYHARMSGGHRVVVIEPDGSSRVLSGAARAEDEFSLVFGGAGLEILTRRLATDLLGGWASCPTCHGGSADHLLPGWCETCRGERTHPDLHSAHGAIRTVLARYGTEWDISRTEFLNAMVAPKR